MAKRPPTSHSPSAAGQPRTSAVGAWEVGCFYTLPSSPAGEGCALACRRVAPEAEALPPRALSPSRQSPDLAHTWPKGTTVAPG